MRKKQSKVYFIPYVKCGECGDDTPLSCVCTMKKKGCKDIHIWSTSCCDIVPLEESDIIGYLSLEDLQKMGYAEQNT